MTRVEHSFSLGWEGHNKAHYPVFRGAVVEAIPYLTLPFLGDNPLYDVEEGWKYSPSETSIHGSVGHAGVDFRREYGSVVAAPASGYVMASYFAMPVMKGEDFRRYQDKEVGMGLGLFVQLYVPSVDRHVILAHLSRLYDHIPYSPPQRNGEKIWFPTNYTIRPEEISKYPEIFKYIEAGKPIGEVGFSGLTWGYQEMREDSDRPIVHDPILTKSWDNPHIHMEECRRDDNGTKQFHRDPYAVYNTYQYYPTPRRMRVLGREPLFILGSNGLPAFAK